MAKKSFKDSTHLDRFFSDVQEPEETRNPARTHQTHEAQRTHETHDMHRPNYYRINLKLNPGHKEYLEQVSWEARKSITQYLNDLIDADKAIKDIKDT